nr:hypothetical protein [uncultured Agathobaculum sp.]
MRKFTALGFAVCGTLLVLLLFAAGRMLYINLYSQSYADIAGTGLPAALSITENDTDLPAVTDPARIDEFTALLSSYTYKQYPHFFPPRSERLAANRLTVTFENGNSIGVNADGYVFINGELRSIEGERGQEFYHRLYVLVYPNAA